MKTAGILTFHRAHNYGAVLQCYALKEVLRRNGVDVKVIDYRQPQIEENYKYRYKITQKSLNSIKDVIVLLREHAANLYHLYLHIKRERYFLNFQNRFLNLSDKCIEDTIPSYDIYVIGSDMLWDDHCMMGKFEKIYWGDFKHRTDSIVIGYAISGSKASLSRCKEMTNFSFFKNFSALSVREESLSSYIKECTNIELPVCLDPTLLADRAIWDEIIDERLANRKFIVTYYIRVNEEDIRHIDTKVKALAREMKCEVININGHHPLRIETFVSILKFSKYLVTDSFHGVVFSSIFQRPFNAIRLNDSHDERYVDLMKKLNIENLIVEKDFTPNVPIIDYDKVDQSLALLRERSLSFLKENVK